MVRVLITGVTGQDGGYLVERLSAEGAQVHGLVREQDEAVDGLLARSPDVQLHSGDLAAPTSVQQVVAAVEPDEIYHLGGVSSVARSWQLPLETAEITALGTAAILEAAWELQQRTGRSVRLVQASSGEIFGRPDESPQNESTPVRPVNPYGAAKAYTHHLVAVYRGRGLSASSCILFNHESPRRPESFVTRKITMTVAAISQGRESQLRLGNLEARRDWGWAPDYVDCMVRAVRHPVADDYVVATGRAHSVRDFVAAAFAHVGIDDWDALVATDDEFIRTADAPELVGDSAKARDVLGWAPTVDFDQIVARMVDHDLARLSGE